MTMVVEQRELLRSFIARELRQRYKGSLLGWAWALIRPLVMLAIYGLVVGVFFGMAAVTPQFAVFLYSALIGWNYFSAILTGCVNTLPANAGLINKAAFQKELLLIAVVVVATLDLLIQGSVLLVGYAFYGSWPSPSAIPQLLTGFGILTLLGFGLGLLLAAANVYFRDIGYLVEVALQVGFWTIPIIYSASMVRTAL